MFEKVTSFNSGTNVTQSEATDSSRYLVFHSKIIGRTEAFGSYRT